MKRHSTVRTTCAISPNPIASYTLIAAIWGMLVLSMRVVVARMVD